MISRTTPRSPEKPVKTVATHSIILNSHPELYSKISARHCVARELSASPSCLYAGPNSIE